MITALESLLERVKAATGPDRELDEAVALALCEEHFFAHLADAPAGTGCEMYQIGKRPFSSALRVTASIDAALALVERVLPLAFVTIEKFAVSDDGASEWRAWVKLLSEADLAGDGPYVRQSQGYGKSPFPPLAILSALLQALISKGAK